MWSLKDLNWVSSKVWYVTSSSIITTTLKIDTSQDTATKAVRLPGEQEDAPGTRKYVFRTLEEANEKWKEACLSGEISKLDA